MHARAGGPDRPCRRDERGRARPATSALPREADLEIASRGIPEEVIEGEGEVVVRVSLSNLVQARDTQPVVPDALAEIDISVADPDKMWLRSEAQLVRLGREFRRVLKLSGQRVPNARRIHLFASVPTPAGIVLGQAINPRMTPQVALDQFSMQKYPRHEHVLTLTVDGAVAAPAAPGAAAP